VNLKLKCHCGINNLYLRCHQFTNSSPEEKAASLSCTDQCPKVPGTLTVFNVLDDVTFFIGGL
jgi:hypothetical protein